MTDEGYFVNERGERAPSIRGIHGLEALYGFQPWAPQYIDLLPDPWGSEAGYLYNAAFEGAMEVQAAEAIHDVVRAELAARRKRAGPIGVDIYIAETGTCDGFSTAFIAHAAGTFGRVWTCEHDLCRSDGQPRPWPGLWRRLGLAERVTAVIGDSREESTWNAAELPNTLDVVFLDSEHRASTIVPEWDILGPRLRPGGILLMHDTELREFPDVAACAREIAQEMGTTIERLPSARGLWLMRKPATTAAPPPSKR